MIVFPNAKINIGLDIVEKRPDGFHNIETVFYPIGLSDVLEIVPSKKTVFFNEGLQTGDKPEDNLVMKAYRLVCKLHKISPVEIHLYKKIPFGSGLGGGSSDAAFTILLLNELFGLSFSEIDKLNMASELGSDCAFFIKNSSCFASGKGNIFEKTNVELKDKYLVLVCPETRVNTAQAYHGVIPIKPEKRLKEQINYPISEWKENIKNDFEKSIFNQFPDLAEIKKKLYEAGAEYSSMSGSGSSVYGIFGKEPKVLPEFKDCFVYNEKIK